MHTCGVYGCNGHNCEVQDCGGRGKTPPPCGRGLGAICAVVGALSSRELLGYALGVEMWFFVWIRQKKWIELLTV